MSWELVVVCVCIFFSFLFSASETALTSLGRLEAQRIIVEGGRPARLIGRWMRDEQRWLTTILVGNNVASIIGSSLITLWATRNQPRHVTLTIAVFTAFIIVFAEIIPKLWANEWSTKLAPQAIRFLVVIEFMLRPLIFVLKIFSSKLVSLTGISGGGLHRPISEEELEQTIEMATKGGGIDRETGEALSNVIEFPERVARDIMVHRARVQALNIASSQEDVLRFIAADRHSRYPVIRGSLDNVVGILLTKEMFGHLQRSMPGSWTKLVRRPYFIAELTPLGTVLRDMKRQGVHLALVRNETGVVTGILTLEDILEEIVGEIRDETDDPSEAGTEEAMGGPRVVSGEIPIVDFNDLYDAALPIDGSYSTLNGYLLSRTGGQLPPVGTLVFGDEKTFRVHSVSDVGIATVELIEHSGGPSEN